MFSIDTTAQTIIIQIRSKCSTYPVNTWQYISTCIAHALLHSGRGFFFVYQLTNYPAINGPALLCKHLSWHASSADVHVDDVEWRQRRVISAGKPAPFSLQLPCTQPTKPSTKTSPRRPVRTYLEATTCSLTIPGF